MRIFTHAAARILALGVALTLSGCGDRAAANPAIIAHMQAQQAHAVKPGFRQLLEITIDGKVHRIDVDHPRDGHLGGASLIGNRQLTIYGMDRSANFLLSMTTFPPPGQGFGPGSFEAYECVGYLGCEREPDSDKPGAGLLSFPDKTPPSPREQRFAYKGPVLGLQPVSVTVTKVEDAFWDGAGPTKRVQGSFKGVFVHVEQDQNHVPRIAGAVRQVEGKFDLHAVIR